MLTQLIFKHALRMRVKFELSSSSTGDKKNDDLSGKRSNPVTSNLQNVVNGRDFLVVVIFTPKTVAISLYFWYEILGWKYPLIEAEIPLNRLTGFLRETGLLDQLTASSPPPFHFRTTHTLESAPPPSPGPPLLHPNAFTLRVPGPLTFERGKISLIDRPDRMRQDEPAHDSTRRDALCATRTPCAVMPFWTSLGGDYPVRVLFWFNFVVGMLAYRVLANLQPYWMGRWADAYAVTVLVSITFYLGVFLLLVLEPALTFMGANAPLVARCSSRGKEHPRSARGYHLPSSVPPYAGSTLRPLPASSRASASSCQIYMYSCVIPASASAHFIAQLVGIVLVAPAMLLPGLICLALGAWVWNVYMKAQLPVKRDMSNKKAPALGHTSAAVAGLVSICVYCAQDPFRHESYRRIDDYLHVRWQDIA
ncbi:unnamed protein product [Peniophora sp. CBMAI 1063]|nr:unnamed protein product [Peniophora sp. CBMAI 1063]